MNLAIEELAKSVREHIPDASDEEVMAAAALQFASDHGATPETTAGQLARIIVWFRKNDVRVPKDTTELEGSQP